LFALNELYSHSVVKAIRARRFQNPALHPALQHLDPQSASPTASNQILLRWSRIGELERIPGIACQASGENSPDWKPPYFESAWIPRARAMSRTVTLGSRGSEKKTGNGTQQLKHWWCSTVVF
jgi:hypothetical protein